MAQAPSAPLPTGQAPAGPPAGWAPPPYPGGGPYAPPRRGRSRTVLIVVCVIIVVLLVVGVVATLFLQSSTSPNINVTGINFVSPDDVCGLNGATDTGFSGNSSQSIEFTYQISGNTTTNGGTAACTIHSVSTTTPGISLTGANVPLVIPVNSSQILMFAVNMPSGSYTGVLTLVMT